jgi:hypothetical protein
MKELNYDIPNTNLLKNLNMTTGIINKVESFGEIFHFKICETKIGYFSKSYCINAW